MTKKDESSIVLEQSIRQDDFGKRFTNTYTFRFNTEKDSELFHNEIMAMVMNGKTKS